MGAQALSPPPIGAYAAALIADILADRGSRYTGFGPAPMMNTPFPAMFKTGTANQFQHIWALCASARFTVGVWMGNFSGETVVGRTGSSIPARIAAAVLTDLEAGEGGEASALGGDLSYLGAEEVEICALSGMSAGPYCSGTLGEWIPTDHVPGPCNWHLRGGEVRYPAEYRAWLAERFRTGGAVGAAAGAAYGGRIRIPEAGAIYYLQPFLPPDAQALRVETVGFDPGAPVYTDGQFRGSLNAAGIFVLPLELGPHRIQVTDSSGTSAEVNIEVR
jgi:penicillin-binding protein 1C